MFFRSNTPVQPPPWEQLCDKAVIQLEPSWRKARAAEPRVFEKKTGMSLVLLKTKHLWLSY